MGLMLVVLSLPYFCVVNHLLREEFFLDLKHFEWSSKHNVPFENFDVTLRAFALASLPLITKRDQSNLRKDASKLRLYYTF